MVSITETYENRVFFRLGGWSKSTSLDLFILFFGLIFPKIERNLPALLGSTNSAMLGRTGYTIDLLASSCSLRCGGFRLRCTGEAGGSGPPPRLLLLRYHGVLVPRARDRHRIVPATPVASRRRTAMRALRPAAIGCGGRPCRHGCFPPTSANAPPVAGA